MEDRDKIEITAIQEIDLPQLASLQSELINEKADMQRMQNILSVILKDNNYCLLGAKKNGQLVGSLVGIVCHDLFGKCIPFMIVENMIITKHAQGQGIGSMLMEEVEKIAKSRGCRYITLVSSAKRGNAHRFYLGCGFESQNYKAFKKYINGR
jgi:GNAT superfamily N-acetyltransferase